MTEISQEQLDSFRAIRYCSRPDLRIQSRDQAVEFVNQRHIVFLYATPGVQLPSLWTAVSGDRPVSPKHDDPGQIIWDWKDRLLGARVWYYAKILRQRSTILSMQALPYFYALSPHYGDPEIDFLEQYEQGLLPMEARLVFETLLRDGALDSITLRKNAHLTSSESNPRFNKALEILQQRFMLLPTGIAETGAWRYSFIYDLTHRYFPDLLEKAREISEHDARRWIIARYLENAGAASEKEMQRLFAWRLQDLQRTLASLVQREEVLADILMQGRKDHLYAAKTLISA